MTGSVRIRPATPADAEALNAIMVEAFEGYRGIARPGWEPPPIADELPDLRERLAWPDVWCEVGEDAAGGGIAGHVAFMPSSRSRWPERDPALAHFWQLFVRPPYWGTGLAAELHARSVAAARERGYTSMRLYTPAGQDRARRFYEREGWVLRGEPFHESHADLELVEYRRGV